MANFKGAFELKIWLVDLTHTGVNEQSLGVDTFPLAIGCIASYAESHIKFKHPIRLFRYPQKLGLALLNDGSPHIIGLSNFVWNQELSLATARRIKELNPKTVVVMGGPNFPLEAVKQEQFLRAHPEIDFYIVHEAEAAFVDLVKNLVGCALDTVKIKRGPGLPSVLAIDNDGAFHPARMLAKRLTDLDEIPSPYVTGKLDEFFDGRLWPLIQTKRGCPYSCTYCTEGNNHFSPIAKFSLDHIRSEIEYIGKKMSIVRAQGGRSDLYIGDSNFGMYEEDIEVANALARSYTSYCWPDHINTSTGKNQKQRILEVARIVEGRIVLSGSVQSLDPVVQENIKRKNISADELMLLAKEARDVDANSYCEVILGLPGETKASHFQTLRTVVNAGFNKVIPYQLMILSGSELSTDKMLADYGMELRCRVLPRAFGTYVMADKPVTVADIEDICVASRSMTFEDYVECRIMHLAITIFYNDIVFGTVLKTIKANGLSVFRWLELILELISGTDLGELFMDFRHHTETELWKDRKELEAFIQHPGTIERYGKGEIGFNLLYTFKACALVQYVDSLAAIVESALNRLCAEGGYEQKLLSGFFQEVIRWDAARMANIVKNLDHQVTETFTYDIMRYAADEQSGDMRQYRYPTPVSWRFKLSEGQKDYMRRNLKIFGEDQAGIGRILSNSHTKQLLRQPVIVDRRKTS